MRFFLPKLPAACGLPEAADGRISTRRDRHEVGPPRFHQNTVRSLPEDRLAGACLLPDEKPLPPPVKNFPGGVSRESARDTKRAFSGFPGRALPARSMRGLAATAA
jgi:hypothetical protein